MICLIDPRYLHAKTGLVKLLVTYEALQEYVATIEETNPIYVDRKKARKVGFQDIPLPAAYPSLFWNEFKLTWLENQASLLNAQSFTYNRPLLIQRDYQGEITLSALRRNGNKQWSVHILHIYDQSTLVATVKTTVVITNEVT